MQVTDIRLVLLNWQLHMIGTPLTLSHDLALPRVHTITTVTQSMHHRHYPSPQAGAMSHSTSVLPVVHLQLAVLQSRGGCCTPEPSQSELLQAEYAPSAPCSSLWQDSVHCHDRNRDHQVTAITTITAITQRGRGREREERQGESTRHALLCVC